MAVYTICIMMLLFWGGGVESFSHKTLLFLLSYPVRHLHLFTYGENILLLSMRAVPTDRQSNPITSLFCSSKRLKPCFSFPFRLPCSRISVVSSLLLSV